MQGQHEHNWIYYEPHEVFRSGGGKGSRTEWRVKRFCEGCLEVEFLKVKAPIEV